MVEVGDNWRYKSCKAPVKSSPPTNQHPVFLQAGCPSCRPTNSVKSTEGKIYHGLVYPKLTWGLPTLSLATNSSWLPWGGLPCLSSALWCQYPIRNYQNNPNPNSVPRQRAGKHDTAHRRRDKDGVMPIMRWERATKNASQKSCIRQPSHRTIMDHFKYRPRWRHFNVTNKEFSQHT